MSELFWLSDAQMARPEPYFPKSHGKPRVDDRRVLSRIIFINRNGLRWRDAPKEYGPHKTLDNRWKRWSDKGIFARIMAGLAAEHGEEKTVMIDAIYLKAHRTATSMGVKKVSIRRGPRSGGLAMLCGSPVPRQQSRHLRGDHVGQPGENIGQPCLGIDVVQLRGDDQGIHEGGAVAAALGAGEEP